MLKVKTDPLSLANLQQPEVRQDPYKLYAALREQDPVHCDETLGFWVLTRFADVSKVLHDQRFSKARGLEIALRRMTEEERERAQPVYDMFARQMLYADPPYHTSLRSLVNKCFTPRVVEQLRDHVQQVTDGLLDAVQQKGRMDIIADIAYPLPAIVVMELLGLPLEERAQYKEWTDDFTGAVGLVRRSVEALDRARYGIAEMTGHICALHDQLHKQTRNDLLSELVRAEEDGRKLTHEELVAQAVLLLFAGHETTTNLIGNGVLALLRHPDQMELLRSDPSLMENAVDELLRYDSPTQIAWRVATEDVEIGGKTLAKGKIVNLVLGAANRDPDEFPHPDELDIRRENTRHIAFSRGIHYCLGAPLARIEAASAFGSLLQCMPDLQLAATELEYLPNPTFRALKSLPVTF